MNNEAMAQAELCAMLAVRIRNHVEQCETHEEPCRSDGTWYTEPPRRGHGITKTEIMSDIRFLRRELSVLSEAVSKIY